MSEPSAPRQVVVLREGPPKRRGILVDVLVGILGVALLVASVALVDILPEEEVPPKQFEVSYLGNATEYRISKDGEGGLSYVERDPIPQGTTTEYQVIVDRDNVYEFKVTFGLSVPYQGNFTADDVPSSLPDRFRVEWISPNGTLVGTAEFITPDPYFVQGDPIEAGTTPHYRTDTVAETVTFRHAAKPADEFVAVNNTDATKSDVLRLVQDKKVLSKGTWTIRVTVVTVGDCPEPGANAESIRRAALCMEETDNTGEDAGNPYTIRKVLGSYYDILVRDPDDPDDLPPGG